jgi:hypothetical protein
MTRTTTTIILMMMMTVRAVRARALQKMMHD